jgi:hypothetical protein
MFLFRLDLNIFLLDSASDFFTNDLSLNDKKILFCVEDPMIIELILINYG